MDKLTENDQKEEERVDGKQVMDGQLPDGWMKTGDG